jgi:hypothetical protein
MRRSGYWRLILAGQLFRASQDTVFTGGWFLDDLDEQISCFGPDGLLRRHDRSSSQSTSATSNCPNPACSVTVRTDPKVRAAIATIGEDAWLVGQVITRRGCEHGNDSNGPIFSMPLLNNQVPADAHCHRLA